MITGCNIISPTDYGIVFVGHPQVFTREHMLETRSREKQWLEQYLSKENMEKLDETRYQGLSELQIYQMMSNKMDISYAPLSGALKDEEIRYQIDQKKYERELQAAQHKQKMKAVSPSAKTEAVENAVTAQSSTPAQSQSSNPDSPSSSPSVEEKNERYRVTGKAAQDVLKPETTSAKLSAIDELREKRAYREEVISAMEEKQLDDIHDLFGSTIYNLKFDISLLPGNNSTQYALLILELEGPGYNAKPDFTLFQKWAESLQEDIKKESVTLQDLLTSFHFNNRVWLSMQDERIIMKEEENNPGQISLNEYVKLSKEDQRKKLNEPQTLNSLKKAIARYVQSKYHEYFAELVDIKPPIEKSGYYISSVQTVPHRLENFQKACQQVSAKAYISIVEPKEYSQNISDVAANESLTKLLFSIAATLPQGIGLNDTFQNLKSSQSLLHGIKRRPLVMGYSNGLKQFGWLLGPKFSISEEGLATFAHTPARYSFNVSIVAPAWWASLKIKGKYGWINQRGEIVNQKGIWENENSTIEVDLPADIYISALTTALFHKKTNLKRKPYIDINMLSEKKIILFSRQLQYNIQRQQIEMGDKSPKEENQFSQSFIVYGRELWRNPQVYIGSQKADEVHILPDMGGLVVRFNSIQMPSQDNIGPASVDLMVATSMGIDIAKEAVVILPNDNWENLDIIVTNKTTSIEGNKGNLMVSFNTAWLPSKLKTAKFYLPVNKTMKGEQESPAWTEWKKANPKGLRGFFASQGEFSNHAIFPIDEIPFEDNNIEEWQIQQMEIIDAQEKYSKNVFLNNPYFIRFNNQKSKSLKLFSKSSSIDKLSIRFNQNQQISIKIPYGITLLDRAFPKIKKARDKNSIFLRLKNSFSDPIEIPLTSVSYMEDMLLFDFTASADNTLQESTTQSYEMDIQFYGENGDEYIPVSGMIEISKF